MPVDMRKVRADEEHPEPELPRPFRTVDEVMKSTVDEVMKSTVDQVMRSTVDQVMKSTVDQVMRSTVDQVMKSTVDQVTKSTVDRAWDTICESTAVPQLGVSGEVRLAATPSCLACSDDGTCVLVGHRRGLSVFSTSSLACTAVWELDGVQIVSIHCTRLGEMAYLIATVDDMGVSRVLGYYADQVYLIKVINETEDISQRSNCTKIELSAGSDYVAAAIECSGNSWLEVYRFPRVSWLKELEGLCAASVNQVTHVPGAEDAKFSPVSMVLKIKPPNKLSGTSLKSPLELLQKTESGAVIGCGQNHMISIQQWEEQNALFKSVYRKYLGTGTCERKVKPSLCSFHFLLPGGLSMFTGGVGNPPGLPAAICVWWSGDHNLFQYLLHKPAKDKQDGEPKADVLWPNAQEIRCSAVSRCTKFLALGLAGGSVTVWDRCLGLPWSVLSIPSDSDLSRLNFLDNLPFSHDPLHPRVQVLVTFRNGDCHVITAGRGVDSQLTDISERHADCKGHPTAILSVGFLQTLVLLTYRNGSILLQDTSDGSAVASLVLPSSHCLATPWEPVFALDPVNRNLFVRGDGDHSADEELDKAEAQSSLFIFSLRSYSVSGTAARPRTGGGGGPLEDVCNQYLKDRAVTLEGRNETISQTWKQLQQHCLTISRSNQRWVEA